MEVTQLKKHICHWPGCQKTFSRSDHLQRHRLNHSSHGSTCQRCRAHFKRPDLLERHMARHRERDLEAGGEGLGVVETRKRLWEDMNGTVIKNRPWTATAEERCRKRPRRVSKKQSSVDFVPEALTEHLEATSPTFYTMGQACLEQSVTNPAPFDTAAPAFLDSWGLVSPPNSCVDHFDFGPGSENEDLLSTPDATSPTVEALSYNYADMTVVPSTLMLTQNDVEHATYPSISGSGQFASFSWPDTQWDEQNDPPVSSLKSFQNTAILSFYHCDPFRQMPLLGDECRSQVLHVITEAGSRNRNGCSIQTDTPLLSLQALQSYCGSFFSGFNDGMAIIHRPTFQPSTCEPLLLLAILLIGAAHGDQATCNTALEIYDALPTLVLRECVSSTSPELWQMQVLLLLECFGRLRGNQQQHDMAHVYHTLLVQLLIRNGSLAACLPRCSYEYADLELQWNSKMYLEEHKRLIYSCFLLDAQSTVFFAQKPCMSVSELDLDLPCNPAAWEANTADEWYKHAVTEPQLLSFRSVIQDYFCRKPCRSRRHLNALSHILVLYGLIAVSQDMRCSQRTFLNGDTVSSSGAWIDQMVAIFDVWKAEFDAYRMDFLVSLRDLELMDESGLTTQFRSFVGGAVILYHAAKMFLYSDISARRNKHPHEQKVWSSHNSAVAAVSHAAHSIREALLETGSNEYSFLLSSPWCLYVAGAVCSAFSRPGLTNEEEYSPDEQDDCNSMNEHFQSSTSCYEDGFWNANHQMSVAISQLTVSGRENLMGGFEKQQAQVLSIGVQGYLRSSRCQKLVEAVNMLAQR